MARISAFQVLAVTLMVSDETDEQVDLDTDLVMADKRGRGVITDDGGEPLMFPLLLLLS